MTSLKVTIEAADLWEVRGALHAELSSAAEHLQRAADEYWSLERGELPAGDDLPASRARIERVLRLLDCVGIEKDDSTQTVPVDHGDHDLLLGALASRAHAIRDQLSDEFTAGYDERAGKAQVLNLMERYERTQALLAVIRGQVTEGDGMTSPLKIETDDERDVLREIVARITHDYPIDDDLDQLEAEIVRLTLCARLLRMAGAGSGPADAALVAALCDQERELVQAVDGDKFRLRKIDAPAVDSEDWCWAGETLEGVRRELQRSCHCHAQALKACRRLIARAREASAA